MKLSDIKVGMDYLKVRKEIIQSENHIITNLPTFYNSDYMVVENLNTKEQIYILRNLKTGIITDVTIEYSKAINEEKAIFNLNEILKANS